MSVLLHLDISADEKIRKAISITAQHCPFVGTDWDAISDGVK